MSAPVLWWVSWKEVDSPEDSRPLRDPPGPKVIAWWKSGEAGDGSYATMCALVLAPTEAACEDAIKADWPSKKPREWRFRNRRDERPLVFTDRWPFSKWSLQRLAMLNVEHDVEVRT